MKRRTFLKALTAASAALTAGAALKPEPDQPEKYDHWNQALKGADRRRYFKREPRLSYLRKGPEGKLTRTT